MLEPGDDLLQLAEDAIERGADVIGMAGGDGSQALVASVASAHDVAHVCIPAGTRNHFALDLGLDRDDVVGALDAFGEAVERRIDLATVNGRVFVNNASMGVYAKIVQSPEYRDAKLKTAAAMLPDMLGTGGRAVRPALHRARREPRCRPPHMILVSNDPYELDHLDGRGSRPRLDAGTLGIAAARIANARRGGRVHRARGSREDPELLRLVGVGQRPGSRSTPAGRSRSGSTVRRHHSSRRSCSSRTQPPCASASPPTHVAHPPPRSHCLGRATSSQH